VRTHAGPGICLPCNSEDTFLPLDGVTCILVALFRFTFTRRGFIMIATKSFPYTRDTAKNHKLNLLLRGDLSVKKYDQALQKSCSHPNTQGPANASATITRRLLTYYQSHSLLRPHPDPATPSRGGLSRKQSPGPPRFSCSNRSGCTLHEETTRSCRLWKASLQSPPLVHGVSLFQSGENCFLSAGASCDSGTINGASVNSGRTKPVGHDCLIFIHEAR